MNAIQPSRPTAQSLEPRRLAPRRKRVIRRYSLGSVAGETTAKLVVNVVLSTAALAGLIQLLPYHQTQQAKLREVREEVQRTEARVNNLRNDFSRSFAPGEARRVMHDQSYRVDPNQRQVVWQDLGSKDDN
jgi:cell division protein FtsB